MEKDVKEDKQKTQLSSEKNGPQKEDSKKEKTVTVNESELNKLQEEAAQYKDKYIRLYAEIENLRKRTERDKQEFVKYANEELITEFLNILDDLERSVQAANSRHEDYEAFLKGVEMVMAHIYEMLKKNHVTSIEAKGKIFDPHCHEIMMQEESDEHQDGEVLEEFQKGYMFNDRVIRTAKVKIAKGKEQEKTNDTGEENS